MKELSLLLLENSWADYQHFFSLRQWIFVEVTVVYLGKDEKIHFSQNGEKMKVRKQTVNSDALFSCTMIANLKCISSVFVIQGVTLDIPLPQFIFLLSPLFNVFFKTQKAIFSHFPQWSGINIQHFSLPWCITCLFFWHSYMCVAG